ncbi:MAG: phage baseplate assembly protein V [Ruminiclostridium sp.]|nr:phage baseplate assembly protein V [Ruminiclostridium sp.]
MSLFDEMSGYTPGESDGGIINGVVTGTVKENYDKDNPGKVKVELFLGESGLNVTGWIPVMTPYAGNKYGGYALPEIGDEVVVAFRMGDRNCPIVIGSIWSGKNPQPAETVTEKNMTKRFVTKGNDEIMIDDTENKQKIEIKTANGKTIMLDEEKDSMTVHDKDSNNSVTIDSKNGEISIKAEKKITIDAGGVKGVFDGSGKKISLEAATVSIKADQTFSSSGTTTKIEGTNIEIKANASIKQQSSALTEIKGAMVKIN